MLDKRKGFFYIDKPQHLSDYILKHKITGEVIVKTLTEYVEDDEYELVKRLPEFEIWQNNAISEYLNKRL